MIFSNLNFEGNNADIGGAWRCIGEKPNTNNINFTKNFAYVGSDKVDGCVLGECNFIKIKYLFIFSKLDINI